MSSDGNKMLALKEKLSLIDPNQIITENPWILWPKEPYPELLKSLEYLGQLEPILIFQEQEKIFLIHGYKRTLALKNLKKNILALKIEKKSPKKLGFIYYSLNNLPYPSKWALVKAFRFFSKFKLSSQELAILGIHPKGLQLKLLNNWIKLPKKWDNLLQLEHLDLEVGGLVKNFSLNEQELLFLLFKDLKWSKSNQKKVLQWLNEISLKTQKQLNSLLEEMNIFTVLSSNLSPQDKIKKILNLVWKYRYPLLSQTHSKILNHLKNLQAGTGWTIDHPFQLENSNLIFKGKFSNPKDLSHAIEELKLIAKQNPWANWESFLDI